MKYLNNVVADPAPETPVVYRVPPPLLIAGASAAGYWLAHAYESAYLAYFGLPNALVHVSLNTAVVAGGAVFSVAVGALFSTAWLTAGLKKERLGYNIEVTLTLLVFAVLVYNHVVRPGFWRYMLNLGLVVLAVAVVTIGVQAYRRWAEQRKQQASTKAPWVNPLHAMVVPWIGWDLFGIALLLYLTHGLASFVGTETARRETTFLTLHEPSGFVILRTYDDAVIAASLDRKTHKVGPEVVLLSPSKRGLVTATKEDVGPLAPAKARASAPSGAGADL